MHFIRENVDVVSIYKRKRKTLLSEIKFVVDKLFFPTDLHSLLLKCLKTN